LSTANAYFREVSRYPCLGAEEERALARRAQAGDRDARERLVQANLKLVISIARTYASKGAALMDLVAEGNLALLAAVDRFDPGRGLRFSTYAVPWIKHAIKRARREIGDLVHVPQYVRSLTQRWREIAPEVKKALGREPGPRDMARALETKHRSGRLLGKIADETLSLKRVFLGSDGVCDASESIPDRRALDPALRAEEENDREYVRALLDTLPPRDALVLRLRFGLDRAEPRSLRELASELHIARESLRQIEIQALKRLHERAARRARLEAR
jgi:RNA polymerase primary sigma factor